MMDELQGTVAVVTGGFRGIGMATAKQLADAGAQVAVLDLDESGKEAAEAELPGGRAFLTDVCDVEQAAKTLGLSRTNGYRQWTYAKAWLFSRVSDDSVSR